MYNVQLFTYFRANGGSITKQSQQCLGTAGRLLTATSSPTHSKKDVPVRHYHEVTGDIICPSMVMGIDHLRDPRLNKVIESPLNDPKQATIKHPFD